MTPDDPLPPSDEVEDPGPPPGRGTSEEEPGDSPDGPDGPEVATAPVGRRSGDRKRGVRWPDRVPDAAPSCDWSTAATWTFEPVDVDTFPAIRLAAQVGAAGGVHPAIFNAADEVAVAAFLAGRVSFPGIVDTVESVITEYDGRFDGNSLDVQDVLAADRWARTRATDLLSR